MPALNSLSFLRLSDALRIRGQLARSKKLGVAAVGVAPKNLLMRPISVPVVCTKSSKVIVRIVFGQVLVLCCAIERESKFKMIWTERSNGFSASHSFS